MGLLSMFKTYLLNVKSIETLDNDFYAIHFSKPQNLIWEAGSYARFLLSECDEPDQKERWLTIASLPSENCITVITRVGDGASRYKKQLICLTEGDQVEMKGLTTFKDTKIAALPLVCFAINVGIAAIRPIVKELEKTVIPIHIYFLNDECHALEREMEQLSGKNSCIQFKQVKDIHVLLESTKLLSQEYKNMAYYCLAGQPKLVQKIERQLLENGIAAKQVKKELFKGL